jgi:hypothetical protein
MRFAIVFGLLGLILVVSILRQVRDAAGAWWLLVAYEAYLAVCILALAVTYGLRHAGLPVEGLFAHPVWSPTHRAILLPYAVLAGLTLYLSRWFDREDLMNPVGPGLFVGRLPFPSEHPRLADAGITAVLSLCWEFPLLPAPSKTSGLEVACVPILDGCPPSNRQFREAMERVALWRAEGRTVLIHCAQGHGRSATIAAAVLCRLGVSPDVEGALTLIRTSRPRARPSRSQREALEGFLDLPPRPH